MDTNTSNTPSSLEQIRRDSGDAQCRIVFREACLEEPDKGAAMLNDPAMSFGTLVVLIPEIRSQELESRLTGRNRTALKIVDEILENQAGDTGLLSTADDAVHSVLRWMADTADWEQEEDAYEQVLDICVSVLLDQYRDEEILPLVDSMIFNRAQRGRNIHDLVWAFFRTGNPQCLKLTASHLHASDSTESQLARKLLRFEPAQEESAPEQYITWMTENSPFLYFTAESMQFSSKPQVCKIDWERKYLQRPEAAKGRLSFEELSQEEEALLHQFRKLNQTQRHYLAQCSHEICRQDPEQWKKWLYLSPSGQLEVLKSETEV